MNGPRFHFTDVTVRGNGTNETPPAWSAITTRPTRPRQRDRARLAGHGPVVGMGFRHLRDAIRWIANAVPPDDGSIRARVRSTWTSDRPAQLKLLLWTRP